jgi:hypothetical protein
VGRLRREFLSRTCNRRTTARWQASDNKRDSGCGIVGLTDDAAATGTGNQVPPANEVLDERHVKGVREAVQRLKCPS